MEAPPFSNLEEHHDDSLFNYLNSLSPLNPPAMDYSLFTSPNASSFEESTFLIARDNLLDTSNPQVSSQNVPTYSTQDCDYNNLISTTQSLMDTNPIQTGNHEVPEVESTKDFTKFLVHITGEDFCRSTLKMKSKQLDPSNMKKKRKLGSCSKHEKEEESADFSQSTSLKKKRKIRISGHCKCKKTSCLRKYCECFKGGVGCSPSCKCQGCENIYGKKDRELQETEALQISRPLVPLPYLSLENPQRSFCAELFGSQNQELAKALS